MRAGDIDAPDPGARIRLYAEAIRGAAATGGHDAAALAAMDVADAERRFDGWLLDRLRRGVSHRETVLWDDDGHRKPRLVVTFPEDATPEGPLDAFEQALLATPADAAALGYVDAPGDGAAVPGRGAPAVPALDGGWAWVAIDTPHACARAVGASGNDITRQFVRDMLPDGTFRDGRAYYALSNRAAPDEVAVVVAVGGRGPRGAENGPFALGANGSDPYPGHASRIRALADGLGFPLPRECHPLYGVEPDTRDAFHPAKLPPHVMAQARAAARAASVPLEDLLGALVAEALDARDSRSRG